MSKPDFTHSSLQNVEAHTSDTPKASTETLEWMQKMGRRLVLAGDVRGECAKMIVDARQRLVALEDIRSLLESNIAECFLMDQEEKVQTIITVAQEAGISFSVQSVYRRGFVETLADGKINIANKLKPKLVAEPEMPLNFQELYQQALKLSMVCGDERILEKLVAFTQKNGYTLDFMDPEVVSAYWHGLEEQLKLGHSVLGFVDFVENNGIFLDFSKDEITRACEGGLRFRLFHPDYRYLNSTIAFVKKKNIDIDLVSVFQEAVTKTLQSDLSEWAKKRRLEALKTLTEGNGIFVNIPPDI